jgi:hypothetical protein
VTPLTLSSPAAARSASDVVARAGRQHLDLGVAREPLGDVPRVKFGAAADVRAVALNHDRQFH